MANLLERVPMALMEPLDNYEAILPGALPAFLASATGDSIDDSLGFISGAMDHQMRVHDEASKVFKGTIDSIEYIDRKVGDWLMGRKAVIYFTGSARGNHDKEEEQSINTDWFEYNGYDPHLQSFWLSLSQTVVDIAEDNIGKECLIRKAFKSAETKDGGDRIRYIASLRPIAGGDSKSSSSRSSKSSGSSKSSSKSSNAVMSKSEIAKVVMESKRSGDLYDDLDPKTAKLLIGYITDTLEIKNIDDRYDHFLEVLSDGNRASKKLKDSTDDALDHDDDKRIAVELFLVGAGELE